MLMKKLAKMEKELKSEISALEGQTGRKVTMEARPYDVYVRHQWDDYHTQKELDKQHREKQRKKQTQQEMMCCRNLLKHYFHAVIVLGSSFAHSVLISPHSSAVCFTAD